MSKSDKVNVVIALFIAISLWVYVLTMQNPSSSTTIKSVPINFSHEETLSGDGLVVLSRSSHAINIKISGNRSSVDSVKAGDFRVVADLEGLKAGENTVRVTVIGPDGVQIDNFTPEKVKVTVDELVTLDRPVAVKLINQNSDDSEPHIVQLSRNSVPVTGAKSLVEKVVQLTAELDATKVGDTMKALSVDISAVDAGGNEVYGVTPVKDRISVTAVLHKKKTVALRVPVTGNDNYFITREVVVPKTITLKGAEEDLADIAEIQCEPIDVAHVYGNTVVNLVPILPENIEATMESEHLQAQIVVTGATTVEYYFDESDIVFEGVSETLVPTVEEVMFTVRVSGSTDVISGMGEKHFKIYADVAGLDVGEHMVPIRVVCTNNVLELEYNPNEINVTIEDKSQDADAAPDEVSGDNEEQ